MFRRFARERNPLLDSLDEWTKATVGPLAKDLDAVAVYPFDNPPLPFLTWARKAGAGHVSPLGLNIHPTFGLWHAYRAALLFPVAFDLPSPAASQHPCDACAEKPCLSACPVSAFDGKTYDVASCGAYLRSGDGQDCMAEGCKARRACPVGTHFTYHSGQIRFHMRAFLAARLKD
jgi:epoxyqueuosine reductase QueG